MTPIRTTTSICPRCYRLIEAALYEEKGAVWLEKRCPEHGSFNDLVWSDARLYHQFEARDLGAADRSKTATTDPTEGCPFACGLCPNHESSTVLGVIDVTERCNLSCPTCFAKGEDEVAEPDPSLDELKGIINNLAANTNASGLQFSGGEPTLRADLPELIAYARTQFEHVEVNTNGVKMAASADFCRAMESAGLSVVYLQFDGVTEAPYEHLRGRQLLEIKLQAIENHRHAGPKPAIVLVPTIVKGVNDDQIGAIIKFALKNSDIIRGVNFQPVSFCGRTPHDPTERITVSDVIHEVEYQTGLLRAEDFYPPSVMSVLLGTLGKSAVHSHFSCGAFAYLVLDKKSGTVEPLTKYVDMDKLLSAYKRSGKITGISALRSIHPSILKDLFISFIKSCTYNDLSDLHFNLLFIGAMHFMDTYNFDCARVRTCVIHYGLPDGRIVPFCAYNNLHRAPRAKIQIPNTKLQTSSKHQIKKGIQPT
jgi:uncharacterized radical SAM superfamily Fe-S cluster-containing enzyme